MYKFEFILKEKLIASGSFEQLGKIVVSEVDFDSQKSRFEKYISNRVKRYPNSDHVLLINKLDGSGNFIEVVQ